MNYDVEVGDVVDITETTMARYRGKITEIKENEFVCEMISISWLGRFMKYRDGGHGSHPFASIIRVEKVENNGEVHV